MTQEQRKWMKPFIYTEISRLFAFLRAAPPLSESLESSQAQIRRMTSRKDPGLYYWPVSRLYALLAETSYGQWGGFSNNDQMAAQLFILGPLGMRAEPLSMAGNRPREGSVWKNRAMQFGIRLILS